MLSANAAVCANNPDGRRMLAYACVSRYVGKCRALIAPPTLRRHTTSCPLTGRRVSASISRVCRRCAFRTCRRFGAVMRAHDRVYVYDVRVRLGRVMQCDRRTCGRKCEQLRRADSSEHPILLCQWAPHIFKRYTLGSDQLVGLQRSISLCCGCRRIAHLHKRCEVSANTQLNNRTFVFLCLRFITTR